jgi:hypothetical protein
MRSAIFTSGNQAYQVSKIIYAGPVHAVPETNRRNECTHSFKIVTTQGATFSYYKNEESARKSRNMLGAMLDTLKPDAYKHGYDFIDPLHIVSFSNVVQFKKPLGEFTHGFAIMIDTVQEKSRELWLRYKAEDTAQRGRKSLWAAIHNALGMSKTAESAVAVAQPEAQNVPF